MFEHQERDNATNSTDDSSEGTASPTALLLIVYGVIGTIGVAGNTLVILVYSRSPSFTRNVTNSIVCNQSAIDLAMSVVFLLVNLGPKVSLPSSSPALADFLCKVWISEYAIWALGASSTCNLVYLTIERYIAVFHPLYHRSKLTLRRARFLCVVPWIVGPLHELGWGLTNHATADGQCSSEWSSVRLGLAVGFISLIDHYIIPLCLMLVAYSRIIYKLRTAWRAGADTDLPGGGARHRLLRQASRNVIITTFLVSLTYLICWGPNEIVYFYANMGGDVDMNGWFFRFTVVMALGNMCVNPFIYAMCYKDFRQGLSVCLRPNHVKYNAPLRSHSHDATSTTHGLNDARRGLRNNIRQTTC